MKTRCNRCRTLIEYGERYCDKCKSIVIKSNKDGLKDKKADDTLKTSRWQKLRKQILLRDKCCVLCWNESRYVNLYKLQVHHIVKRTDDESLIYEPSNLVTLCRECHERVELLSTVKQRALLGDYKKELFENSIL